MSDFKVGDKAYILIGDVASFGDRAYKAHILRIDDGWKCDLMCVDSQDNPIGESFFGVLGSLYKSKNEAIDAMIENLSNSRDKE